MTVSLQKALVRRCLEAFARSDREGVLAFVVGRRPTGHPDDEHTPSLGWAA